MNEPLMILTERVDDIPLLLAQMQRMGLARLLDEHFPTHGNRTGLSLGLVTVIWLTHVLSQADHRMNHVQPWAEHRLETLRACSDSRLSVRDLGDDRLADVLRHLSDDPSHHRALAGSLSGDYLDPDHRTASDSTPCDCSFSSSATGVSLVSVYTYHLYQPRWGFFRTPLKMSER